MASGFVVRGGKAFIGHDPHAGLRYGVDMKPWLAANPGVALQTVVIRVEQGVTTVGPPYIVNDVLTVFVEGLDEIADDEGNFVTFHFTCNDGQHDDRTIYFVKKEN